VIDLSLELEVGVVARKHSFVLYKSIPEVASLFTPLEIETTLPAYQGYLGKCLRCIGKYLTDDI
jgi:hypothetical protein